MPVWELDAALAAMLADMLDSAGSTSFAICVGRRTRASLPRSWKVSVWHPLLLRPHVKVLFLPASLQGVIAMPELGFSASRYVSQFAQVQYGIRLSIISPSLQYPAHASLSQFSSVQLPRLRIPPPKHSPLSIQNELAPQQAEWPLSVLQGVSGEIDPSG
jgi:hypothetical protein